MTYADAEAHLLALPRFAEEGAAAYRPGLERMAALLEAMGAPHAAYPSVHVAGTNGKGSVASMVAAMASAAGRRVGLHTSPHLWHLAERLRVDGVPAPEDWLAEAVARYRPAFEAVRPSFFEATVALSFRYFADAAVDLAVVEVGLGGRLDATNVLAPRLALITSIGLDHTDLLGHTIAAVAREKAGIVKAGVPVLTTAEQPEALAAIEAAAQQREAPFEAVLATTRCTDVRQAGAGLILTLQTPARTYADLNLELGGAHQAANATLAVRAAEHLDLPESAIRAGLAEVRHRAGLRGRLEVRQARPLVVADVGHNPDGLAAALAFMRARCTGRLAVALGLMRDKDAVAIAQRLAEAGARVFAVGLGSERGLPAAELAARLAAAGADVEGQGTVADAQAWFAGWTQPGDGLLVTGSHQVVAALAEAHATAETR